MRAVNSAERRTTYEVRDAEGNLVAKHHRVDKPDGTKQVWWEKDGAKGLNGTPLADLPLYGSELVGDCSQDELIVLVEGEKARDTLEGVKIPAVGTVTGACATPGSKALEVLRGREVTLWPDNDDAGREHMQRVARQLHGVACEVRWYEWPEAGEKDDAADHPAIQKGDEKAVDQLLNDLACAPAWRFGERDKASEATWDEPIPLPDGLPPVSPLDPATLPKPLRGWIVDVSERMQIPPDFPAVGALVVAGSLIGRKLGIHPKRRDDWLVVPNLWGAVVGRPSLLKSPALAEAMKPLDRLVAEAYEQHEKDVEAYEAEVEATEAMKAALKDEVKKAARESAKTGDRSKLDKLVAEQRAMKLPEEPKTRRYKTSDATTEKLTELLLENPQGILSHRDELSGWLRNLDKQGREGDRAFYLESWNGTGSYDVDRIGRGSLHIPALCLSSLGGIQPGPLSSYVYEATQGGGGDDGLLQRFQLLVWPDAPKKWRNVDRWPNTEAKNKAYEVYKKLDALKPEDFGATAEDEDGIPAVRFTSEAQEAFDEWREELEGALRGGELVPALEAHLAKYRSLMPSLALLFQLMEFVGGTGEGGAVELESTLRAAAWCEYLETHARRLYASAEAPEMESARKLLKRIKGGDMKDSATVREVYRKQWAGLPTPEMVSAATGVLEEYGWLRVETAKTGGRSTTRIRLHPTLKDEA